MIADVDTIKHIWPEAILVLLGTWILVAGAFQRARWWWTTFALASYVVVAAVVCRNEVPFLSDMQRAGGWFATGPVIVDYFGFVMRLLAILVGGCYTLVAARTSREELASEFIGTLMLLVSGAMLASRANDLVLLFVSLELISIPTYVLLFLGRKDRETAEATAKYFFLSIFSSAVLLYGFSFLYGLAGTTVLYAGVNELSIGGTLAAASAQGGGLPLAPIALVLILAGLGFKMAAVPFHFYAPDVYQGATNGNAGLLAIAPKIGGLAALVRVLVVAMPNVADLAWQLLLVTAIASMTLGNVCALWQRSLRRMMAFSSIAHAGYMLIGIVVALGARGETLGGGIGAATLYVIVYALGSIGVFSALAYLGGTQHEVDGIDDLSGLSRTQPLPAAVIAICLVSLAGIPPLAGFWGKLTLFLGAIQASSHSTSGVWFVGLAVAGALNAAIGAAYYLRVIAVMYFGTGTRQFGCEGGWGANVAMRLAGALVLIVGLLPGSVTQFTERAEKSVQLSLPALRAPGSATAQVTAQAGG